jgi:hypothetical protein
VSGFNGAVMQSTAVNYLQDLSGLQLKKRDDQQRGGMK